MGAKTYLFSVFNSQKNNTSPNCAQSTRNYGTNEGQILENVEVFLIPPKNAR